MKRPHVPVDAVAGWVHLVAAALPWQEPVGTVAAQAVLQVGPHTIDLLHLIITHLSRALLLDTWSVIRKKAHRVSDPLVGRSFDDIPDALERVALFKLTHLQSRLVGGYEVAVEAKETAEGQDEGSGDDHDHRHVHVSLELVEAHHLSVVAHHRGRDQAADHGVEEES